MQFIKLAKGVCFPNRLLHMYSAKYDPNSSSLVPWFLSFFWHESTFPLSSLCGLRSLDPQNVGSG